MSFGLKPGCVPDDCAEWKPLFLRQAREFLFVPLPLSEASKRVSIFDRETRNS